MICSGRSKTNFKLILILFIAISTQETACSKTFIICDQGCDFASISDGINSADPGDTIEVQSGTYHENVNVSKQLTIFGKDIGSGKPVIDAGGKGSAITLSADGATVEGFNLTNSLGSWLEIWAGIEANSDHNTLKNNLALNNENGILITGSDNTIQDNDAINNIYGIRIKASANNSITSNNLKNNNYGLFILASNDNAIQRNQANNNDFGILLNESKRNNLSYNQMTGNSYNFGCQGNNYVDTTNLADGKPIYYLVGSANQEIDSSKDVATVCCINCNNLTIRGLELKNNFNGIYLENTSNTLLEGNNISNNRIGLVLVNSYHNTLRSNEAAGNTEGMVLSNSRYNMLHGNKALKSQAGLHLVYSDYNRILGNQFSQNDRGLWLYRSGQNLLSLNNLTFDSLGAELSFAWFNQLSDNNVSDNNQGILLYWSTSNNLSSNRIFNNSKGILYDPLDNNTLGADNRYWNNAANLTETRTRTTEGAIQPSIAIFIISNPEDGIIINEDENVKTPGPVHFIDPGKHIVLVQKRGYKDGKLTIEIPQEITRETFPDTLRVKRIDLMPEENISGR